MPLYDYECDTCGKREEIFASYSEKNLPALCCEGGRLTRIVSIGGIQAFGSQKFDDLYPDSNVPDITSKEQLARECHKAGVYSKALMGSDKYERIMRGEA